MQANLVFKSWQTYCYLVAVALGLLANVVIAEEGMRQVFGLECVLVCSRGGCAAKSTGTSWSHELCLEACQGRGPALSPPCTPIIITQPPTTPSPQKKCETAGGSPEVVCECMHAHIIAQWTRLGAIRKCIAARTPPPPKRPTCADPLGNFDKICECRYARSVGNIYVIQGKIRKCVRDFKSPPTQPPTTTRARCTAPGRGASEVCRCLYKRIIAPWTKRARIRQCIKARS